MMFAGRAAERFTLLRCVGRGAMGVVYEGRDRATGERVALKTLHDLDGQALYRLKNEFRQLHGLDHDNLVRLRELVGERDQWYLVMDFVDGNDIVTHVRGRSSAADPSTVDGKGLTPPPGDEAGNGDAAPDLVLDYDLIRSLLLQVASGLQTLHDASCVHRDVKPSNIMVGSDGRAKLLDFGLVWRPLGIDSTEGSIVGTVAYMAPEQALGMRVGPSADCYALGVVLFELLTGRLPHSGPLMTLIMAKQAPAPARASP
jgi:serine/threonine protein kinase